MAARFAGSRHIDSRRRRRLATENGEVAAEETAETDEVREERLQGRDDAVQQTLRHFPVRKVISRRPWKVIACCFAVLASAAGLIVTAWLGVTQPELLGPALVSLFQLPQPRAMLAAETGMTLLAGQLCLLIWWARSRSLQDFNGRYHFWLSAAFTCFGISMCTASGLHTAVVETLSLRQSLPTIEGLSASDLLVAVWLAPTALIILVVARGMTREMSGNRAGLLFHRAAVLLFMLWAGSQLELSRHQLLALSSHSLVQDQPALATGMAAVLDQLPLVAASAGLLSTCLLFLATLLHTRYVIFLSVNPPQARPSLLMRVLRGLTGRNRKQNSSEAEGASNSDDAAAHDDSQSAGTNDETTEEAAKPVRSRRSTGSTRTRRTAAASAPKSTVTTAAPEPAKAAPAAATASAAADETDAEDEDSGQGREPLSLRASRALDAERQEQLKGLSKRERRKLRKQWRDEDRENEGDDEGELRKSA